MISKNINPNQNDESAYSLRFGYALLIHQLAIKKPKTEKIPLYINT